MTQRGRSIIHVIEPTIEASLERFHEIVAALDGMPGIVVERGRRVVRFGGLEILVDSEENPRARIVAL